MKVVPVIDILGGLAVHAIKGRRNEYKPLKSVLCPSAEPLIVASAFEKSGFDEIYIADLDAITTGRPNFSLIKQIAETTGLSLMVDAGTTNIRRAKELIKNKVSNVIIGTETLPRINFIREAVEALGKEQVAVSLDLKGEKVLGKFGPDQLGNPLDVFFRIKETGVNQVIILDLARVGSGKGVNINHFYEVLKNRDVKVFVGGGVRGIADLQEVRKAGVFGVLVATALHSGEITLEKLMDANLL